MCYKTLKAHISSIGKNSIFMWLTMSESAKSYYSPKSEKIRCNKTENEAWIMSRSSLWFYSKEASKQVKWENTNHLLTSCIAFLRLPWWLRLLSVCLQSGRPGFDPWVGKISWRRKWQPTPVLLPGKSYGKSLIGYSLWGRKESDTTERLDFIAFLAKQISFPKLMSGTKCLQLSNSLWGILHSEKGAS